jgi:hypothetical protein
VYGYQYVHVWRRIHINERLWRTNISGRDSLILGGLSVIRGLVVGGHRHLISKDMEEEHADKEIDVELAHGDEQNRPLADGG